MAPNSSVSTAKAATNGPESAINDAESLRLDPGDKQQRAYSVFVSGWRNILYESFFTIPVQFNMFSAVVDLICAMTPFSDFSGSPNRSEQARQLELWISCCEWVAVTCYCNEAHCSAHKCQSDVGACFSLLSFSAKEDSTRVRNRHGCVDSLPHSDKRICEKSGDIVVRRHGSWPMLMCCKGDLCNYRKDIDLRIKATRNLTNTAASYHPRNLTQPRQNIWFQAAVIAVPIAGGVILLILILTAIRLLRSDSQRHAQLLQLRKEHMKALSKTQLYDNFMTSPLADNIYSIAPDSEQPHHKLVYCDHSKLVAQKNKRNDSHSSSKLQKQSSVEPNTVDCATQWSGEIFSPPSKSANDLVTSQSHQKLRECNFSELEPLHTTSHNNSVD